MKIKFLTNRDGFKIYQVAELSEEEAQHYLDACQAVEVKDDGIRETQEQPNNTESDA